MKYFILLALKLTVMDFAFASPDTLLSVNVRGYVHHFSGHALLSFPKIGPTQNLQVASGASLVSYPLSEVRWATYESYSSPAQTSTFTLKPTRDLTAFSPVRLRLKQKWDGYRALGVIEKGSTAILPAQIDPEDSTLIWFLLPSPALKGIERTFTVQEAKAIDLPAIEWKEKTGYLQLVKGPKTIFSFSTAPTSPPVGVSNDFARGGYIHPLYSPNGQVLTEEYPEDHRSHKGLWMAWPEAKMGGQPLDFWNLHFKTGVPVFQEWLARDEGPVFTQMVARIRHDDLRVTPAISTLEENLVIRVWNSGSVIDTCWVIDYSSLQHNVRSQDFIIGPVEYGGMALRGAQAWKNEALEILTSEGKDKTTAHKTKARWILTQGAITGVWSSVALIGSSQNPLYPEPVMCFPPLTLTGFDHAVTQTFTLKAGAPLAFRYRLMVRDRKSSATEVESAFVDFNQPSEATEVTPNQ